MAGITVRGIPEIKRNLSNFPRTLVIGCFNRALSRAAAVFEEEVRARCPETDFSTSSEEYGHLVDNLHSTITIDSQGRGGKARIHFGQSSFVALWVEYGHRMMTHKGKQVGAVAANPFMRAAFDAAADRALEAVIESVREYMKEAR